jgi:hypothetical protein
MLVCGIPVGWREGFLRTTLQTGSNVLLTDRFWRALKDSNLRPTA